MCGIFACVFCSTDSSRKEMINVLLTGLHRLEYRGYDSAGIAVDGAVSPGSGKMASVGFSLVLL